MEKERCSPHTTACCSDTTAFRLKLIHTCLAPFPPLDILPFHHPIFSWHPFPISHLQHRPPPPPVSGVANQRLWCQGILAFLSLLPCLLNIHLGGIRDGNTQASLTLSPPAAIKRADEKGGGLAIWSPCPVHRTRPGGRVLGSLLGMTCEEETNCALTTLPPTPLLPRRRKLR